MGPNALDLLDNKGVNRYLKISTHLKKIFFKFMAYNTRKNNHHVIEQFPFDWA